MLKKSFAAFTLLLTLFLGGCSNPPLSSPSIFVSLPPYAYFVEKIGGDNLKVEVLVPRGTNPHMYEPSPQQVSEIAHASLWLRSHDPFETKLLDVLKEQSPQLEIVDLTEGLSLIGEDHHCCHHHHETLDLHVWLSPELASKQAKIIEAALSRLFPEKAPQFQQNLQVLLDELNQLDQALTLQLKPFSDKTLLVSHPAFGYFCNRYHLKQLSLEQEGKEPLPQDILHTLEQAKASNTHLILTQPQYSNKAALLVAQKLNLAAHEIDPYQKDYPNMMHELADLIALSN